MVSRKGRMFIHYLFSAACSFTLSELTTGLAQKSSSNFFPGNRKNGPQMFSVGDYKLAPNSSRNVSFEPLGGRFFAHDKIDTELKWVAFCCMSTAGKVAIYFFRNGRHRRYFQSRKGTLKNRSAHKQLLRLRLSRRKSPSVE